MLPVPVTPSAQRLKSLSKVLFLYNNASLCVCNCYHFFKKKCPCHALFRSCLMPLRPMSHVNLNTRNPLSNLRVKPLFIVVRREGVRLLIR